MYFEARGSQPSFPYLLPLQRNRGSGMISILKTIMSTQHFPVHWSRVRQKPCSAYFCCYCCSHFYFRNGSCLPWHTPFPPWSCLHSPNLFPFPLLSSLCFAPPVFLQKLYKTNTCKFTLFYCIAQYIPRKIKVLYEEQSS